MSAVPGAPEKRKAPVLVEALHPDWQQESKCKGVGSDYFFGREDLNQKNYMNIGQVRRAAKLCDTCPVFRDCISHALLNKEEYGIWAGSTGKVRKNIRAMISRGEVTIPEVIEDYCNGKTEKYRPRPEPSRSGRHSRSRDDGVRAEARGDVAL